MDYSYERELPKLLSPQGNKKLKEIRDRVDYLLGMAGSFTQEALFALVPGDEGLKRAALETLDNNGVIKRFGSNNGNNIYLAGEREE